MDVAKAFDTIKHEALWTALAQFGIEPQYISLLKRLYVNQKATVSTDEGSDVFEIQGCTKQGDPPSSLLFNTVLQAALEDDLAPWRDKGMGISLGVLQSDCLSNLRFAKTHLEKTKILSNQRSNRRKEVTIDNIKVEVLHVKERAKHLGKTITFEQQETTEIKSRIRAALASFTKSRQEST